jgi:glutathione synthase/RimK-type ligase-like ATP-grasp enzyme
VILLWGVPGDSPLDAVHRALLLRRAPVLLLDQRRTASVTLDFKVADQVSGELRVGAQCVDLQALAGIYLRPQDRAALRSSAGGEGPEAPSDEVLDEALLALADLAPAVVLNRPDAMAANGSKPYQYEQIRAVGLKVPDTLITSSPTAARAFVAHYGRVIYKSISGIRSIVGELNDPDVPRLADVAACPTQLQARVAGVDVRVHVVGDRLFACEVHSEAVDYRYAALTGHAVEVSRCRLPDECAGRCFALARATELPLAGIDFRRTPDGEWYCFEVNPSPGFTYYQQATGDPIDAAVADLLTAPT